MAKTLSGPPRRPPGPGAGSGAGKGSQGPARRGGRPSGAVGNAPARRRAGRGGGRGRWPRRKAVLFAVLATAILAGMAWALLGSRLLVVRSVRVIGAGRMVSAAQVLAAAHVPHGLPLIRVNTGAIARQVEQLRQVQYAEVSRDWPATVVITVQPRTPVFAVTAPGGYAVVDRFGVSISDVAARPAGLPLLNVGYGVASLRGNPAVLAAARVLAELPPRVADRVRNVSAISSTDVSVTLSNGAVVIWGDTENAKVKARELTLLMRKHARTYDVSSPGTAMVSG
jgi:cell division protein FtsQ